MVYVGAQPSARKSEGILVKAVSPIRTVADLKGRKVGYARGSSSHNYIAAALEQHGLDLGDIQSVSLGAADANFAFGPRPTSTRPPGPCRPRPGSPPTSSPR